MTKIAKDHEDVGEAVRQRSVDYVRVTMSSTSHGHFVKYRAASGAAMAPGESGLKVFWGVDGDEYGEEWVAERDANGEMAARRVADELMSWTAPLTAGRGDSRGAAKVTPYRALEGSVGCEDVSGCGHVGGAREDGLDWFWA